MATFARSTFSHANYAAARPSYSQALYNIIFAYHAGQRDHLVDMGTGHGLVARAMCQHFTQVTACDPSEGMLSQATKLTPKETYPNITFAKSTAESLSTVVGEDAVDMVVAAQAAHWFDYKNNKVWQDLNKVVKKGGTIAFWGYPEPSFPNYARASRILERYLTGREAGQEVPDKPNFASYWPQPGTALVQGLYRDIVPPADAWQDIHRMEYHPSFEGPNTGEGTLILTKTIKVRDIEAFSRSLSAAQEWQDAHPDQRPRHDQSTGVRGEGDIVDMMFDEIRESETDWRDPEHEVVVEWATGLLLARRK